MYTLQRYTRDDIKAHIKSKQSQLASQPAGQSTN
jgi:hypothetical protein